ncbi:MAG: hypothetical protein QGF56_03010 [Verrucomicrobiota bacterium]|nr:hypothetical protein [Verrucomicrobiota bacterium]
MPCFLPLPNPLPLFRWERVLCHARRHRDACEPLGQARRSPDEGERSYTFL